MKPLSSADFLQVCALLERSNLFASDLTPEDMPHFLGRRVNNELVVIGAIQPFGRAALLRSVAIAEHHRGSGQGKEIVAALENHARAQNLDALYLLTESAQGFFEQLAYQLIPRSQAPKDILSTPQFAQLCPDDAACLWKPL